MYTLLKIEKVRVHVITDIARNLQSVKQNFHSFRKAQTRS